MSAVIDPQELLAPWLHLALTPGLSPRRTGSLLRRFGLPEQVLNASLEELSDEVGATLARALLHDDPGRTAAIELNLNWLAHSNHHLLMLGDSRYPQALLHLSDPPPVLWAIGKPSLLNQPSIGIVGSRHATRGGLEHAQAFAQSLGDAGFTVVSGMALGIDAAAHQGALQTQAGTIAVLAHGLDKMYPASNRKLGLSIANTGLILSEFALGSLPLRDHFPRRNRLIAALSNGVLVVEAARQSGSLITARIAAELGRDVFAIPGSIDSPLAKGCHQLIKEGAKLVDSANDILDELSAGGRQVTNAALRAADSRCAATANHSSEATANHNVESQALLDTLGWDPIAVDELGMRSDLGIADLNAQLLLLELAGAVERLADGRVRRLAARQI